MSNEYKDWERDTIQDLSRALRETTYKLMQMVTDGNQQEKVKQIVEHNLLVLGDTYEEFMELVQQ